MSTCYWLDLETLGTQPIMSKKLSRDWVPLDTWDWGPVTFAFQALSLVEKGELVQVRFTLRLRDHANGVSEWRWIQSLHGFVHDIKWIVFHGHLDDYFQKPPLEGGLNTKSGDHGNPKSHIYWFIIIFIMCEDLAWIDFHWNSIWLRAWSHMTPHYNWGLVTTLHDFGSVLGQPLDTHSFMVITLGLCVNWPWPWWVSNSSTILLCGDYTKYCI